MNALFEGPSEPARSLFQDIVEHASDGILVLDSDGYVLLCNPAIARIFQRHRDEFQGELFGFPIDGGEQTEINILRKDGSLAVAEMRVSEAHWEQKRVFIAILRDITERKRMETALHAKGEQLRLSGKIFENTQEGILVTDAQGNILSVNQAFVAVTGFSMDEAVGSKPNLLNSGRHDQAFYREMWSTLAAEGQWRGEIWNRRKSGEIYPEWINISAIRDDEGIISHYVAIFSDISKVKENEERLRRLAHFDQLTGLPNRFLFQDHSELALAQAARKGRQVALMFLDLDRFKIINDTLGHRAGDTLLIEVARRLAACLRAGDTLSRFGGDEFNAVLPDLDNGNAAACVADKLIEALAHPFQIDGKELHVTTSIGIAIYPQDGQQLEQLSRAADAAMYRAKEHGRNTYRFYEADGRDEALSRRFHLENQLRRALDRGEMSLVYQPEVDIESGGVTGMEALLRWRHPELGDVSPEEFIPLAEEIGVISTLGAWGLREACLQNKAWQDIGFDPMWVSVNLSPSQLRDRRLVETVRNVLAETGLEGHWLEFELTEGALMQNIEEGIDILNALKQLGVRISIDDFGTGHSSLAYLRQLPVDTLKIDRSLVAHIATNEGDAAISRTIVALAHNLNLRVVAEGIESAAQFNMLREFQCCDAQGFYFSRPLPPDRITALLGSHDLRQRIAEANHCNSIQQLTGAVL